MAMTEEQLLKRLQSARDYAFEATMNDYSVDSITAAQKSVQEAMQALQDAGFDVPKW